MSADAGEERDVERVAQSIFHAGEQHFPDETGPVGWSNASPSERAASFILARAAITAYTSGDGREEGVEAALKRFQYAVSWVASDSWDHCGECRDRLEWAQSMAGEPLSFDEKSAIAKDYLRYSGTAAIRALSRK